MPCKQNIRVTLQKLCFNMLFNLQNAHNSQHGVKNHYQMHNNTILCKLITSIKTNTTESSNKKSHDRHSQFSKLRNHHHTLQTKRRKQQKNIDNIKYMFILSVCSHRPNGPQADFNLPTACDKWGCNTVTRIEMWHSRVAVLHCRSLCVCVC